MRPSLASPASCGIDPDRLLAATAVRATTSAGSETHRDRVRGTPARRRSSRPHPQGSRQDARRRADEGEDLPHRHDEHRNRLVAHASRNRFAATVLAQDEDSGGMAALQHPHRLSAASRRSLSASTRPPTPACAASAPHAHRPRSTIPHRRELGPAEQLKPFGGRRCAAASERRWRSPADRQAARPRRLADARGSARPGDRAARAASPKLEKQGGTMLYRIDLQAARRLRRRPFSLLGGKEAGSSPATTTRAAARTPASSIGRWLADRTASSPPVSTAPSATFRSPSRPRWDRRPRSSSLGKQSGRSRSGLTLIEAELGGQRCEVTASQGNVLS